MKGQIAAALPKHISAERIARIALTALRNNPKLANCNPQSFLGSLMVASQLGLEPNTPLGQCYLIPYGNDCNFQIGYKGILELAHRTGLYKKVYAHEVYEGDEFSYTLGLEKTLVHKPKPGSKAKEPIAYYAVYILKDGASDFCVMYKEDVQAHGKKFSKSFFSGPWKTNFDEMAKKTCILQVLKYAPKSIEIAQAIGMDRAKIEVDIEGSAQAGEPVYNTTFEEADFSEAKKDFAETPAGGLLL
jgi:recombination protein RecT